MQNRPAVAFFDLGNTLVSGQAETARDLLASRLQLNEKEKRKAGRLLMTCNAAEPKILACALERILPGHDPAGIFKTITHLWREQYESVSEIDGADRLLLMLKRSGIILGLISNTWEPFYQGFREKCPTISEMFDHTVLSFRLGEKKPSAAIFNYALKLTCRKPSECIIVGDSFELDINPARDLGFQTAWVLSRPEREKAATALMLRGLLRPPDIVAADIPDLMQLFEERWLL